MRQSKPLNHKYYGLKIYSVLCKRRLRTLRIQNCSFAYLHNVVILFYGNIFELSFFLSFFWRKYEKIKNDKNEKLLITKCAEAGVGSGFVELFIFGPAIGCHLQ